MSLDDGERHAKGPRTTTSQTSVHGSAHEIGDVEEKEKNSVSDLEHSSLQNPAAAPPAKAASPPAAQHISLTPVLNSESFEYSDRSNVNPFLICCICQHPLYDAVEHTTCNNVYCRRCLEAQRCPQCQTTGNLSNDMRPVAKPLQQMLDALPIVCQECREPLIRSEYAAHWLRACPVSCPFARHGCMARLTREQQNAHIDACALAPVQCEAAQYGCQWSGHRDELPEHRPACPLVAAMPALQQQISQQLTQLAAKDEEILRLRIALETREKQLQGYKDRLDTNGFYSVGAVVDALDTEDKWLLATILRVDAKRKYYRIHYLDWDESWDENIPFRSQRLALAGTYTTQADVGNHAEKAASGTQYGNNNSPSAAAGAPLPAGPPAAAAAQTVGLPVTNVSASPGSSSSHKRKSRS